ncbi:DUF3558 domain-containing protein [Nocardia nova]|uniref:DUF3558 domain-containing protein n=1 Tax=Nocardia nova TaxID=37330 RepID=UPI0015E27A48
MTRNKHLTPAAVLVGVAAMLAACGNDTTSPQNSIQSSTASPAAAPGTPTQPTLTASRLQPPSQDNKYTGAEGRPKVTFDPCTWIPDSAVSQLGFDPSTRHRGHDIVAEQTFLTCYLDSRDKGLQLDSGNVTLDEVKHKYAGRTQDLSVNGRPAVLTPNKSGSQDCSVDLQTKAGYFGITFIVTTNGDLKGIKPCDRIVEAAKTLEPFVGKDN